MPDTTLQPPRTIIVCSLLAATFVLAAGAQARRASNPILDVNFFADGSIAMTTVDGTTVGTSSGAPTVIPAGYYTLEYLYGNCQVLPYFHLTGPGVDIVTGVGAEVVQPPSYVHLLAASTYTWSDAAAPGVVYQFSTSSQVVGSPPATPTLHTGKPGATVSSRDIVGSGLHQLAGSFSATIGVTGKVTLLHNRRPLKKLTAGRYRLTVIDHDPRSRFAVERLIPHTIAVASGAFNGRRSMSVTLTPGRWAFVMSSGKATSAFTVK